MSDFRTNPNFPRHEMSESETRVQWAAVAVILLLLGGLIAVSAWTGGETQTATTGAAVETTGSGASLGSTATMPPQQRPARH
jgi:hypothetical protein